MALDYIVGQAGRQSILIYIESKYRTHYFVITEPEFPELFDGFLLPSMINVIRDRENSQSYIFLFPVHLSVWRPQNPNLVRIYGTWEEVSEFYARTGRSEIAVNNEDRTVVIWCHRDEVRNFRAGYVILEWVEAENGNYLKISPKNHYQGANRIVISDNQ